MQYRASGLDLKEMPDYRACAATIILSQPVSKIARNFAARL
jgi:hypothetical protein